MNAYYLHKPDGAQTDISQCGVCGKLARGITNFDISEKCCTCYDCGLPLGDYEKQFANAMYHHECERQRRIKRDAEVLEKAELIEDYDGPVYLEYGAPSGGWGDGYFESSECLAECLADDEDKSDIEFAYCCTPHQVALLKADSIIESACEEDHEDAVESINGEEEFYAAVDAFNKANEGINSYYVDHKRKVRVPHP